MPQSIEDVLYISKEREADTDDKIAMGDQLISKSELVGTIKTKKRIAIASKGALGRGLHARAIILRYRKFYYNFIKQYTII